MKIVFFRIGSLLLGTRRNLFLGSCYILSKEALRFVGCLVGQTSLLEKQSERKDLDVHYSTIVSMVF